MKNHHLSAKGKRKQLVTYSHHFLDTTEIRQGFLMGQGADENGFIFVCIDTFENRVYIKDVISLETLRETW